MNDVKIPTFYIGTSGENPGLFEIKAIDKIYKRVIVPNGHSIYAVAKFKNYIGYGTRNKAAGDRNGRIEIYKHQIKEDEALFDKAGKVLSVFQKTSVSALEIFSEQYALSGGLDGTVLLWDFNQPAKAINLINAQNGIVLSISAINESTFATLGSDSILNFWDFKTLNKIYTFRGSNEQAQIGGLLKIYNFPEKGYIISHHTCGSVFIHDILDGLKSKLLDYNAGKAKGITIADGVLVIADVSLPRILFYSLLNEEEINSHSVLKPVIGLEAVDKDKIIVLYIDGTAEIVEIKSPIKSLGFINIDAIRSISKIPTRFMKNETNIGQVTNFEEKLNNLKSVVSISSLSELESRLNQFVSDGLTIEAMVLLAEWCKTKNKPLWELIVRKKMCVELPIHQFSAVHFYALANLYERINEPKRALENYQLTIKCSENFKDTKEKIELLSNKTDKIRDRKVAYEFENNRLVIQEIYKRILLNDNSEDIFIVLSKKEESNELINTKISLEQINDFIEKKYWTIESCFTLNKTETKLLINRDLNSPIKEFYYSLEIKRIGGKSILYHKVIYIPRLDMSSEDKIQETKEKFDKINSESMKSWFESMQNLIKDKIKDVKIKNLSQGDMDW